MTSNTINYMANFEQARHNRAQEAETQRSNKAQEALRNREADISAEQAVIARDNLELSKKQYQRQLKDSRVQRANTKALTKKTKADTKYVKRQTKHISKEEQFKGREIGVKEESNRLKSWELALKKYGLDIDAKYKAGRNAVKSAANDIARTRAENDLLVSAFKDPKLLAYLGLTGNTSVGKQVQKDVDKIINGLTDGKIQGAKGLMSYAKYKTNYFAVSNPPGYEMFESFVNKVLGKDKPSKKSKSVYKNGKFVGKKGKF